MPRFFRLATLMVAACIWITTAGWPRAAEADTFPVAIEHAFGSTTIARKPERVATVAWANHEVPLALGIVPVGFAAANFGDDDGDGLSDDEELDADDDDDGTVDGETDA